MGHALAERHFDSYEDIRKWLNEWFASKDEEFFWRGIHKLPRKMEKLAFNKMLQYHFILSIFICIIYIIFICIVYIYIYIYIYMYIQGV